MFAKKHLRGSLVAAALLLVPAASADAATQYVSTAGSDSSACTQSAPCKSFNTAYQRAAAGDVVEVAAGTYGGQSISPRTLTGTPVTVRPASGASVTLTGSLDINTDNIVVRDFKASSLNVDNGSDQLVDVTTVNIDAVSAYFQNTKNLVVKGGRLGGLNNKTPVYVGALPMSYNVTFDGVLFHDATVTDSTVHTECIMVNDVQGMTVKNSRFTNCGYFGLMISHLMGELPPRDVTLENNVFEATYQWNGQQAPYSMLIGPIDAKNFVIRNNTFVTEPTFNGTTWSGTAKIVGNLGALASCQSGVPYSKNVWTAVSCGSTDKKTTNLAANFVDPAAHNWRLKSGSTAIDAGSATDYPATDADGSGRPVGAAADAGAYEYGSTTTPPVDPTPTPTTTTPTTTTPTTTTPTTTTPTTTTPTTTTPTTTTPTAPAPSLVAAYGFNETSGSTFADASGHGLTGTRKGATQTTTAKSGRALSFNGTDALATVADSNLLDLNGSLTLEAWIRPSTLTGGWKSVIFKGRSTEGLNYSLYAANDKGIVTGDLFNGSEQQAAGTSALALKTWSHVAVTYDGANQRVYVNGTLVRTLPMTGSLTTGNGALTFGGNSVWGEWFKGQLDDVRIYSGALSQSAIATDMKTSVK